MDNLTLNITPKEAEAFVKLLSKMTFDDVATIMERHDGESDSTNEESYKVWDAFDDLYRYLIDHGYELEPLFEHEEE